MNAFLLVGGVLMLSAGLVLAFRHFSSGAMFSYLGMWCVASSGYAVIGRQALVFWAVATIVVCAIGAARRTDLSPVPARYFITGGALTGMLAGLTLGQAPMILAAAIGAVLGGILYSRTPSGKQAGSQWRQTVETGLPAIVIMSMAGITLSGIIARAALFS